MKTASIPIAHEIRSFARCEFIVCVCVCACDRLAVSARWKLTTGSSMTLNNFTPDTIISYSVLVNTVILLVKWWYVFFPYVKRSCFTFRCCESYGNSRGKKNVYRQLASVHTHECTYFVRTTVNNAWNTVTVLCVVLGGLWLYTMHKAMRITCNVMYLLVYIY